MAGAALLSRGTSLPCCSPTHVLWEGDKKELIVAVWRGQGTELGRGPFARILKQALEKGFWSRDLIPDFYLGLTAKVWGFFVESRTLGMDSWCRVIDGWGLFQIHIWTKMYLPEAEAKAFWFEAGFEAGLEQPEQSRKVPLRDPSWYNFLSLPTLPASWVWDSLGW